MDTHTISGFTGSMTKAGIVIGDGAKTGVALAAPNGAGTDYGIDGFAYHKADAATNIPLTAVTTAQAADTTCAYLIQINAAGTVSSVKGDEVLNTLVGTATAWGQQAVQIPGHAEDQCPLGAIIVTTTGVTFTPGTTALDAANVETDYVDFIGGLPGRPEVLQSVA
jgi:hypothetical protein